MIGPMASHHRRARVRKSVLLRELAHSAWAAFAVFTAAAVFAFGAEDLVFAGRAATVAGLAALVAWVGRRFPRPAAQREERAAASALAMVVLAVAASWPMSANGRLVGSAALFESVAAITTTGVSVLDATGASPSLLFFRALLEWTGGLWFLCLSITILEPVLDPPSDPSATGATASVARRRRFGIWLIATAVAALVLAATGLPILRAVLHAMSAIAAGGMSPDPQGARALGPTTQVALAAIGLFAATGCLAAWLGAARGTSRLQRREFWLFALLVVLFAGIIAVSTRRLDGHLDGNRWLQSLLLAMQAQSSSGFEFSPVRALDQGSKLTLCLAMTIGGCSLSVAGGVRVMRLLILFAALRRWFSRNAKGSLAAANLRIGHFALAPGVVRRAMLTMLCFAFTILGSWLVFVIYGLDPLDSLVDVVGACTNAGLSAGIASADLDPRLQIVLVLGMLLGRLEFLPFLLLVLPMRHARATPPAP